MSRPALGSGEDDPLRAIAYVSTAVGRLTTEVLEQVLTQAREFNAELEGPAEAMTAVCQRILESREHTAIIELTNARVARRAFPDWTMGCTTAPASTLLALSTARWRASFAALDRQPADEGVALLRNFWRLAMRLPT
ncbi:MAG: BLUF domain-containing protein [Ideonella sp.]|nr:BLUF domain-containing protein [Ideonella sp.]